MDEIVTVITTGDGRDLMEKLGTRMVEERLAACAQVEGPIRSIYRWKGKMERTDEWRCVLKTRGDLSEQLVAAVRAAHPYEVPEIIVIPVLSAHHPYARWIRHETGESRGGTEENPS